MRGILLAYCIGIALALQLDRLGTGYAVLAVGMVLLSGCWVYARKTKNCCSMHLLLAGSLLAGFGWHLAWASHRLAERLPAALEGQDIWVTGVVSSLPISNQAAVQFQFYIEASTGQITATPFQRRLILLNYYGAKAIAPGQHWQLLVRLNRPHGYANPGGFDYEAYLLQHGITAKGYVRNHPGNQLLGVSGQYLQRWRFVLSEKLLAHAEVLPSVGVLLALALGERSQLHAADWDAMSATGTNHLFVISGLHIGLIATFIYAIASACLRALPTLFLYWPRQKIALCLALVAALIYSLLAGFTLSTQRAFVMTAVLVLSQLANRTWSVGLRFLLALAAVLTLNPLAPLSSGFWLSFVAVAVLLMCLSAPRAQWQPQSRALRVFRYWLKPQMVVFAALLPLLLVWGRQVSMLSPLVNMLAIPVVGFVVVPLTLFGLAALYVAEPLGLAALKLGDVTVQGLFAGFAWLGSHYPQFVLNFADVSTFALSALVVAVGLLLAPLPWQWRFLIVPLCLPVGWPAPNTVARGVVDIHILDVGQGLSVIVHTANHTLVYDTGAALSPQFDLGTAAVVPVLRRLGIETVDIVMVSHFDNDHAGGLRGLLGQMPVQQLRSSDVSRAEQHIHDILALPLQLSAMRSLLSLPCQAGRHWQWDGVEFRTLHPLPQAAAKPQQESTSSNNHSCVLQIQTAEHRVLLPGDIERDAERELVLRDGERLRSSILLAPHHGSNSSSSFALLKQVRPKYVIYSAGYHNSFGHPRAQTRQRYTVMAATGYVTHATGMLSFRLQPGQPLPAPGRYRQVHRRYWY